jgi:dTDP-4-amino-4,6-dideoxygalactose transaminase
MQLIRNHGENVVESLHISDIANLVGFNLRMTELTAAIAREQLKNVNHHVSKRIAQAEKIIDGLNSLSGITLPQVRVGCTHSYYVLPIKVDTNFFDASINEFSEALNDVGFPNSVGYVRPLYMLPLFQRKIAIGSQGFPFNLNHVQYYEGMCPKAEMLKSLILCFEPCMYDLNDEEISQMTLAFRRVHEKYLKRL